MDQVLLTVPEVCRALGIGRTKLWELTSSGEIPVVRIGRGVRIPAQAITDWVQKQIDAQRPGAA